MFTFLYVTLVVWLNILIYCKIFLLTCLAKKVKELLNFICKGKSLTRFLIKVKNVTGLPKTNKKL